MHRLLARQIRRHLSDTEPSDSLRAFLRDVDAAYKHADSEHELLERMMAWQAAELLERNELLLRDLETRKRLELELHQSEKLMAVGQLAAGVAHEINTPIQFIGDCIAFLQEAFSELRDVLTSFERLDPDSPELKTDFANAKRLAEEASTVELTATDIPRAFERSCDGVRRVTEIVRAMKEFAHPDTRDQSVADLNRAITNTVTVARNEFKYIADLELDLGELPPVLCKIGDINQVLLNLVVNAAHAIADKAGAEGTRGVIAIRTRSAGDSVTISISDTGAGIPEGVRPRIFEPFFTTKEVGRGTGQGLAISRAIVVDRHNGSITFDTELGRGTTFHVRLPIAGCTRFAELVRPLSNRPNIA